MMIKSHIQILHLIKYYHTQNYNRYVYVLNNPLKYIDPTGYGLASSEGTGNPNDTGGYGGGYGSGGNESYKDTHDSGRDGSSYSDYRKKKAVADKQAVERYRAKVREKKSS